MGKGGSGGVSEYDAYWCPTSFINSALATRKEFEESLKFPAGKRAMLERAARGIPEKSASEVKITTALTKQTLKRGGSDAIDSIQTALATDKDFLALSAVYKEAGAVKVAQKMAAGFLLAAVNPTAKECKVSLQSTMEEMAREAKSPGAISVDAVFGVPLTTYPCRITKQMVNRADSSTLAGIMTAFGGDTSFEELMRKELLELWGKYMAAKQLADEFLLAVATPTAEEIMMSLKTTASKYAKLSALPHAKPLSKAMIKKGGPEATAAIISIFGSSPHFKALVTAEMAEDMSEYVQTNGLRAAAVGVAYKMTQNFLLAAPDPGEKEVLISLKATLDDLAR